MILWFDIDGNPIDNVTQWAYLFEDNSYRQLALCEWPDGWWVSAVWTGLSASMPPNEDIPLHTFSTAIFDQEGIVAERESSTREAAMADFEEMTRQVLETRTDRRSSEQSGP